MSPPLGNTASENDIRAWLSGLPSKEKDQVLARLLTDHDLTVVTKLRSRFAKDTAAGFQGKAPVRRSVADLLRERETAAEERKKSDAATAARERAKREQKAAIARKNYLDGIAGTERVLWKKIQALIATKQPKSYDQVVALLVDLRDLAAREDGVDFQSRLKAARAEHSRRPALIKRMDQAGL